MKAILDIINENRLNESKMYLDETFVYSVYNMDTEEMIIANGKSLDNCLRQMPSVLRNHKQEIADRTRQTIQTIDIMHPDNFRFSFTDIHTDEGSFRVTRIL